MCTIKHKNGKDLTEAEEKEEMARIHRRTMQKSLIQSQWPGWPQCCGHSPRARHPAVQSQVGLRKQFCEQS